MTLKPKSHIKSPNHTRTLKPLSLSLSLSLSHKTLFILVLSLKNLFKTPTNSSLLLLSLQNHHIQTTPAFSFNTDRELKKQKSKSKDVTTKARRQGAALCSPVFRNTAAETEREAKADAGSGGPRAAAGAVPPPNRVVRLHGGRGSLDPLRQHQARPDSRLLLQPHPQDLLREPQAVPSNEGPVVLVLGSVLFQVHVPRVPVPLRMQAVQELVYRGVDGGGLLSVRRWTCH